VSGQREVGTGYEKRAPDFDRGKMVAAGRSHCYMLSISHRSGAPRRPKAAVRKSQRYAIESLSLIVRAQRRPVRRPSPWQIRSFPLQTGLCHHAPSSFAACSSPLPRSRLRYRNGLLCSLSRVFRPERAPSGRSRQSLASLSSASRVAQKSSTGRTRLACCVGGSIFLTPCYSLPRRPGPTDTFRRAGHRKVVLPITFSPRGDLL
jgi:hypothetical protein